MLRLHPSCALDINKQNPSEIHKRYILYACFRFRLYLLKSRKKPNKHDKLYCIHVSLCIQF